ncbi:MAG: cyclic nucleotide-binding domain-containing protein, partial [Deltaproteobacteria bacterium]|nr:cyclic nucleotide-binding domain-containing protein [Deltaproteobacteria bacterium]
MTFPAGGDLPDTADLADALVARGDLNRAEEVLRDGLLARPDSLKLQEDLANLLIRRGKVAESLALLDGLATACAKAGMPGRAIAALKKLARFHPEALQDTGRRIAALAKRRDHELAQASSARNDGGRGRPPVEQGPGRTAGSPAIRSPLFGDFSADELAAVIHGLELFSFAPGDLVVSQGEPGRSLFVVVSGNLKVWVREDEGRSRYVRSLG